MKIANMPKRRTAPSYIETSGPQPLVITHEALLPKGTFARAGGALGSIFGPKGAALGAAAGTALSRITGVGDYKVKSNSIMTDTSTFSGEVPAFGRTDNSTRVRHREFVTDVTIGETPAAFSNTSYVIQPGNATLFPWLSSLAQNYQQYRVHGMVFVFKSTTSDYSAAGALGKVALATNYNVRDSAFANMQELENAEFSVSGKPSLSRVHPIECAPENGVPLVKWVRDVSYDSSGGDDRLYDVGKFQLATQGLPAASANSIIGELWVTYDIEFFKPIVNRAPAAVEYVPVSVPVFDSFAGGTTAGDYTKSLTMLEVSAITKPSGGWTDKAQLLTALRNPGSFTRVSVAPRNARVARSTYRAAPDPSTDPNGSYPAYWETSDAVVLQRKGIYRLRLAADQVQGSNQARAWPANSQFMLNQSSVVPSSANFEQSSSMGHITVVGPTGDWEVLNKHSQTSAWVFSNPADESVVNGSDTVASYYTTGLLWDITIWVKNDHPAGGGVKVMFWDEVNSSYDRANNIGMTWNGFDDINPNIVSEVQLEISYVSAKEMTYYTPAVTGLTSDDKSELKSSIETIEALLPKLRELGLIS